MLKFKDIKLCYRDVMVVPSKISEIEHRSECNPYTEDDMLPIFASPMTTVVDEENYQTFIDNKITPILPRKSSIETRLKYATNGKWSAFSLKEFKEYFCNKENIITSDNITALIDIANGHMKIMYDLVKEAKSIYGKKIKVMVGNIANPETYKECIESEVDFVRLSVGTGSGCITASNTAISFPIASLIDEVAKIKEWYKEAYRDSDKTITKIVADGGIRNYDDIIKALALGADYVMIGSLLSRTFESAGQMYGYFCEDGEKTEKKLLDKNKIECIDKEYFYEGKKIDILTKIFYGMASAEGQKDLYGAKIKTREGICKELRMTCKLGTWVENLTDFLRSNMSYTNSKTLKDISHALVIVVSQNAFESINR